MDDGSLLSTLVDLNASIMAVALERDAASIACVTVNGQVVRWNFDETSVPRSFPLASGPLLCAAFTPDSSQLAWMADQQVWVWDMNQGKNMLCSSHRDEHPRCVTLSPAANLAVTGHASGRFHLLPIAAPQ